MWWLSFGCADCFHGVIIVQAATFVEAMILVCDLDIHPGGEVAACQMPAGSPPPPAAYQGRVLTRAEVDQLAVTMRRQLH